MNYNQDFSEHISGSINDSENEYMIVNSVSSVGEKVKIAYLTKKHENVALDCFRNAVNELVARGAKVISFRGYLSYERVGQDIENSIKNIIMEECDRTGIAFEGIQVEEIPDVYKSGEYQFLGFATGTIKKFGYVNGMNIKEGNAIIGIESSGINNSGFSFVQKMVRPSEMNIREHIEKLGITLGEELVKPSRCYKKIIETIISKVDINGMSYISEGGLLKSIHRVIPETCSVGIIKDSFPILPVFEFIQTMSQYNDKLMFETYNMGVGMAIIVDDDQALKLIDELSKINQKAYKIGFIKNK